MKSIASALALALALSGLAALSQTAKPDVCGTPARRTGAPE